MSPRPSAAGRAPIRLADGSACGFLPGAADATFSGMKGTTRVVLARGAYASAVRAARERSTPATWRRLVRAGQNLRDALDEAPASAATLARDRWAAQPLVDE